MKKCTKIALSLSLLVCGDAFAMHKKGGKKQQTPSATTPHAQWPSPAESSASKASKDAVEAKKTAECKTKFNDVVTAIKDMNVAYAYARALNHPGAFKTDVVPFIAGARASLKSAPLINIPAQVAAPATVVQATAATTDESWAIAGQPAVADTVELASVNTDIAIEIPGAPAESTVVAPTSDETLTEYSPEHIQALKDKIAAATAKMAAQQESAPATVTMAPEAAMVATEISTAAPAEEATPAAPAAATSDKSNVITTWMKFACARSTSLEKAIYFMQNTAHRNLATRKEIGSRLGDAITETVAALNGIHTLCYGKSEIQSSDEIDRLQEPLVQDLETALNLAILPAEGEKQIQVDTGLLKLAAETLQKLNRHEKHQAVRVINATTARAAKHKKLTFLIQANMESRGDHSLDGELSDDEYNGTLDMLNIVAEETQKEATDKE